SPPSRPRAARTEHRPRRWGAVLQGAERPAERARIVVGAPDESGGEWQQQGMGKERRAPAAEGTAVLADHQVLQAEELRLDHLTQGRPQAFEFVEHFLGGRLEQRGDGLVPGHVAILELEVGADADLDRAPAAVDHARAAGLETEPGDDAIAELVG